MAKGKGNAAVAAPVAAPTFPTDAELRAAGNETLSARIRALSAMGAKTAEIAKIVLRSNGEHPKYQHVRNVLKQPLKRAVPAEESNATAN
jgi:hypothetical protein